MLILSRTKNQKIIIGSDVVLTLIDIKGDKVRIGIEAPKKIPVHRMEIHEAILRQNKLSNQKEQIDWSKKPCLGKNPKDCRGQLSKVTYGINNYEAVACEHHLEDLKRVYPGLVTVDPLATGGQHA